MNFEVYDEDGLGRIGKVSVNNKEIITPNLFPVVHPFVNNISMDELKTLGANAIFTNSYIIFQNLDKRQIILNRGLHRFLGYDGIIATDSGAFQQYMYNSDDVEINPKVIEEFQENIGADFSVILDVPVQIEDDYNKAKKKVIETVKRAQDNVKRRKNLKCHWYGPIHGGRYTDLIEYSCKEINKLDFPILALGGLVKSFLEYRFDSVIKMLLTVKQYSNPSRPLHLFGLGLPQFFSLAVLCGCDLMDSAAYILFAKEGRYFTLSTGTERITDLKEFPCHCPVCVKYTPKEIATFEEQKRTELLAKHNLYISFSELRTIRQAIKEGNLWELMEQRIHNHPSLSNAVTIIKDYQDLFEIYEKTYKNRGSLFTSAASLNRPLLYRYKKKMLEDYRVPNAAKYLFILPELDVKGKNSPMIQQWLDDLEKKFPDKRESFHVVFTSEFFGVIPLELAETFPMGQNESVHLYLKSECKNSSFLEKAKQFILKYSTFYNKIIFLIPKRYLNQYKEKLPFPISHPIHELARVIKSQLPDKFHLVYALSGLEKHLQS
ncbi:MAG: tRNA guanosine(15) transglycosylase TgtA [Promethearchaeota archaeon]|nr:MAG: tRNA guanosine(15) transglycosylase TgtA [Candidatus Lokiarchaeota archaeon]